VVRYQGIQVAHMDFVTEVLGHLCRTRTLLHLKAIPTKKGSFHSDKEVDLSSGNAKVRREIYARG